MSTPLRTTWQAGDRRPAGTTVPVVLVTRVLLATITVLAIVVRWWDLGARSLWIDEVFSLWVSRQPMPDLWRVTVDIDLHPPVYYTLLHVWLQIAPDGLTGEQAARLPSAVLGVVTVPVVYLLGKHLGGRTVGVLAAALMAVSPLHIYYAQQARMYTLLTLTAALAVLCLVHVLDDAPSALSPPHPWWWGLVLSTALVMLSHNTGLLVPVAIAAYLLGRSRTGGGSAFTGTRGAFTGLAAAAAVWSVWSPWFLDQLRRVDEEFWLSPPTAAAVWEHWGDIVVAFLPTGPLRTTAMISAAVLAALGMWRLRHRRGLLLLALLVVPPAVELVSSLRRPVFFTQTLVWTSVPFSVLAATGMEAVRPRLLGWAVGAATAALLWAGVRAVHDFPGLEDWRAATAHVAQHARPGQTVLFNAGWTQLAFDEYYSRLDGAPQLVRNGLPVDLFTRSVLEPKMTELDLPRLDSLVEGRSVVWLVSSHDWYTDPSAIVANHLAATRRPGRDRWFADIRITSYVASSDAGKE